MTKFIDVTATVNNIMECQFSNGMKANALTRLDEIDKEQTSAFNFGLSSPRLALLGISIDEFTKMYGQYVVERVVV